MKATGLLWRTLRAHWIVVMALGIWGWAYTVDAEKAWQSLKDGAQSLASVSLLILSVLALVGLLQVCVSRDLLGRLLGKEAGWRALVVAAACGTVLIGPAFIIFPLLMEVHRQGARWAVVVTVLAAYAVKLPMIPLEAQFLGLPFSLGRSLITIATAIPLGLAVEALLGKPPKPAP